MLLMIFAPAMLMAAAIVVIHLIQRPSWMNNRTLIIGFSLIALIVFSWFLTSSDYGRMDVWFTVEIFFLPYLLTGISGFLLQRGLSSFPVNLWKILVAVILLGLVCVIVAEVTSPGLLSILFGILIALAGALMGIVIAIWLAWSLKGTRKLAALLFGIVFPVILIAGVSIGDSYSPESVTQRNGDVIIVALQRY